MTFTAKSLSDVTTRTGQLKDMLQRLEQSQPLAIRLSGTSTAAQVGGFSYEPNSTWGFDPSASAQRTAHSKNVLSGLSYIEFIYPCFALGTSANELGFPSRHIDKTTVGTSAIQVEVSNKVHFKGRHPITINEVLPITRLGRQYYCVD